MSVPNFKSHAKARVPSRAVLAAMLHPRVHLDATSSRYHRLNVGRAVAYAIVGVAIFGSVFMPLIDSATGDSDYYFYSYLTYFTIVEERYDHTEAGNMWVRKDSGNVANRTCLTFRLRMQAAAAMAILSIITSLLTALFAVSDAGLVGCSCLVSAMGPRGFGTVSAVASVTAFAGLVTAFGIIFGLYYADEPCDYSFRSPLQDDGRRLGSGVIITVLAFTAIAGVEGLRFVLIRAAWLPDKGAGSEEEIVIPEREEAIIGFTQSDATDKHHTSEHTSHFNEGREFAVATVANGCEPIVVAAGAAASATGRVVASASPGSSCSSDTNVRRIVASLVTRVVVFALAVLSLKHPLFGTGDVVTVTKDYRVGHYTRIRFRSVVAAHVASETLVHTSFDKAKWTYVGVQKTTIGVEQIGCAGAFAGVMSGFVMVGAVAALAAAVLVACRGARPLCRAMAVAGPHLARAAALADVCCFVCMWLGFILATDMFYGARCNGQLALANRGFKIAPDATSTGYIFLVLAAVASAVIASARAAAYFHGS